MSGMTIKVVGLTDFRKGLKGIDANLPKKMRLVNNRVAKILVDTTRPRIPQVTGAAAASLKPQSTQSEARISAGGPKAPYYPWLDFGGKTGINKSVVRPFYSDGRYIFPTLGDIRGDIQNAMLEGMAELASESGIEVD